MVNIELVKKGTMRGVIISVLAIAALAVPARAQYCSERPGGCCPGRDDTCTTPMADTNCYCDEFCLRSKAPDCCPDVFNNCKALPTGTARSPLTANPLEGGCVHNGRSYKAGESLRINCNTCTCYLIGTSYELQCENATCLIREEIITSVNSAANGWRASNYSFLWGLTLEEGTQRRLGTLKPGQPVAAMTEIEIEPTVQLPESFDCRQKWPGWIEGVPDQGDCGSSWAVSTVSVASDRLAIQSQGHMRAPLSNQNLLSCNTRGQRGCDGGHLDRAWYYMRKYGVVTDHCYPYRSGMDEASKMNKRTCVLPRHQTSPCPNHDVTSGKYHMSPPYRISVKEEDIEEEIFRNGPLQATMVVKEDFYSYAGGVYKYTRGSVEESPQYRRKGYHSVRILGWGVDRTEPDRPIPYWLCANSWGSGWGEDGYFRIVRGQNECEIESFVLGVWADVDVGMMQG